MEMTKQEATDMFSLLFNGEHHIPSDIKEFGPGFYVSYRGDMATFDFNQLTKMVVLAHDKCYRFSIAPNGPMALKIIIHKREGREGSMTKIHPELEEHVKTIRERLNS